MICLNKTKNILLQITWVFIFFLTSLPLFAQTSLQEEVSWNTFENIIELETAPVFSFNDGIGAPVMHLSSTTLPEGVALLSWEYTFSTSLQDFIIYKKEEHQNWELYKNINAEDAILSDLANRELKSFGFYESNAQNGSKIEYRIVARFTNGVKSEVSAPLKVIF